VTQCQSQKKAPANRWGLCTRGGNFTFHVCPSLCLL
jgi:hypothetical protein